MTEQNQNPNGQEVKREIPNQHLADRIAGKVDEQGIEITESKAETVSVESEIPNQHLSDKIAGKVDYNNVPVEELLSVDLSSVDLSSEDLSSEDSSINAPDELPTHLGGIELENVDNEAEIDNSQTDESILNENSEQIVNGDADTKKSD